MIDLVKIGFIIVAIIVLIRVRVPLSVTLIASAAGLGFLFHLPVAAMRDALWRGVVDAETLKLVIALELVLLFSAIRHGENLPAAHSPRIPNLSDRSGRFSRRNVAHRLMANTLSEC